ncbi:MULTISPECIES: efflux RND transporter periplasmic adaptor subunit [unclassified Pseudoalteromonas]|uniref:efflux RND transporter periplasmic adaptor subunit n=1 Tax=unclassified Pseudoalteromonas TaxID=194690 RepID=UPI001F41E589|nr:MULTISPECIES: efflux RND transporter periplasmic adaptor subunit [unclassified Pseudoalteromonas]MCF2827814.1 efflux RND transporter periplasmic adaptor subunit [Pseudoalteromonas sp. OF5H-5]MCF2833060.1 efflux RND transporter periplasmic adaptor subunit [Pseudoalteromonas sp. DL2-H6]MCF2927404.1 efflux RND transporter periplasmic adaptor subunit [Pseudoalteromonas sp. DL2-H1]
MKCVCLIFSLLSFNLYAAAVNVVVTDVKQQQLERTLSLTGSISAAQHAQVSSLTDGVITKISAEAGDIVEENAVLLSLDAALVKAELKSVEAALERAKVDRNNAIRLVKEAQSLSQQKLFAQTELADREAKLQASEATLLEAQAKIAYQRELVNRHQLKAPFTGVIARRTVNLGEWVTRGQTVFELVSSDILWLDLQVPQEYFQLINLGRVVNFSVASTPSVQHQAHVLAKLPVVDKTSRSFLLRLAIPKDAQLRVGASATAKLPLIRAQDHSVIIPSDAILRHPDGGFSVFVAVDGQAKRLNVQIGERIHGHIEVLSGLEIGQQVVVEGNELLQEGQALNIVPGL